MRHPPSRSSVAPAVILFTLLCAHAAAARADAVTSDAPPHAGGYALSPPEQVLVEGAIDNGDGTVTIPAGLHSAAANAWHRFICASFGASDITDVGSITFSANSADAVVCSGPTAHRPAADVVPLIKDAQGRFHMPPAAFRGHGIDTPAAKPNSPHVWTRVVPHATNGAAPVDRYDYASA